MNLKIENWKLLILSIFYMIFSILSYTIEKEKFLNFFQIAGIVIILVGLFQILVYFFKKEYMKPNEFSFSFGVLYCIAGLIVATKPYLIVDNYPIVISGGFGRDTASAVFHESVSPGGCTMEDSSGSCRSPAAYGNGADTGILRGKDTA